jgi:hypothetical protein
MENKGFYSGSNFDCKTFSYIKSSWYSISYSSDGTGAFANALCFALGSLTDTKRFSLHSPPWPDGTSTPRPRHISPTWTHHLQ